MLNGIIDEICDGIEQKIAVTVDKHRCIVDYLDLTTFASEAGCTEEGNISSTSTN